MFCSTRSTVPAVLSLMLLSIQAAPTQAQTLVRFGERIRIHLPAETAMTGRLISLSADSILLSAAERNKTRAVPVDAVRSLQRSLGRSENATLKGALIGLAVGASLFGGYYYGTYDDAALGYTIAGGLMGSALGMVAGGLAGQERWQTAELPAPQAVTLPAAEQRIDLNAQSRLDAINRDRPVRIRTVEGHEFRGVLIGQEAGRVQLLADTIRTIPLAGISNIQQLRPATNLFARRGAIAGGVAGTLLFLIPWAGSCEGYCAEVDMAQYAGVGLAGGSVVGFLLGALVGSLTDRWQTVR